MTQDTHLDNIHRDHVSRCGVVLVTAASEQEAEAIASALVEQRLAACVTCSPVRSIYRWQGQVCREQEWQLMIKTDLKSFDRLQATIQDLHSYDVPEIIALPIVAGQSAYLDWIIEQVTE
ncbi:MAG: divalent-cation tolerance protein CutA [Elainellaceae cyanobacterium]